MENHYQVLGISPSASIEDIKKAYFSLAKKYHPDSGDQTEVKHFYAVSEAYKTLSDEVKRRIYDSEIGLEKPLEKTSASQPHSSYSSTKKRNPERDASLEAFHKNRFRKAVFRVTSFTLLLALVGYLLSIILSGYGLFGAISGLFIGFSFGVNRHFDVSTFFQLKRKQKIFELFSWGLFGLGMAYFVWLVFLEIF